jgi:RND superfamily putative drug exporter
MGDANGSWVGVVAPFAAGTQTAADLAVAVRAVPAPSGALVGGPGGETVDTSASLRRWLPLSWALGALACLVVMFLLAGSVLVPVKAVVLNGLSLVTSLGVVTWVFQDGHGAGLLGFTTPGTLDLTVPTLVFGIALGLSMDYEVFLLARIKEEHDLGADDDEAVAVGLQRTGRIVTLAAATMALTFLTFVVNGVSAVQAIGLGLATAVVVDALVIRTFALPALMHLAGRANWWAPRKLRRFHLLAGVWEAEPVAVLEVGRPVSQAALGALVRPESDDAER